MTPLSAVCSRTRTPVEWPPSPWARCFCSSGFSGHPRHHDTLTFAGHHSAAHLLGLSNASILHNSVHVLFGVAGIAAARTAGAAKAFLIGGGIIYVVLWISGFAIDVDSAANFVRSTLPTTGFTSASASP